MLTLEFRVANSYIMPAAGNTTVTSTGPKVCSLNHTLLDWLDETLTHQF